jgi:3-isopropylmalate/(R)-2-methylmalate dehydratase small subunit
LLAVECADTGRIGARDDLRLDAAAGTLENLTRGETYACKPVPPFLMDMVEAGGLVPHLEKRFSGVSS